MADHPADCSEEGKAKDEATGDSESAPITLVTLIDPDASLLQRAAMGDLHAQREMIDVALGCLIADDADLEEVTAFAEFWGRCVMSHDEDADKARMLQLLALRASAAADAGKPDRERAFLGEALAIAERLSESGGEMAGTVKGLLGWLKQDVDAGTLAFAKQYRGIMQW